MNAEETRYMLLPGHAMDELAKRLAGLQGRVLYIESDSWLDANERGCSTMKYLRLDHESPTEMLSALTGVRGGVNADQSSYYVRNWSWFDPDPRGMDEAEIERMTQTREMSPLTMELHDNNSERREIQRAYIVPERVLNRPKEPGRPTGNCGEPWCHRCNATFFWDPDVEEAPWIPIGLPGSFVHGVKCMKCGITSPAELPPRKQL